MRSEFGKGGISIKYTIKNFTFNLNWSGTLRIEIEETEPFMIWIRDEKINYIDSKGSILKFDVKKNKDSIIELFGTNANFQISELNNLLLKVIIQEGILNFSNSNILWKENVKVLFSDAFLNFDEERINLNGRTSFEVKNEDDFYKFFCNHRAIFLLLIFYFSLRL